MADREQETLNVGVVEMSYWCATRLLVSWLSCLADEAPPGHGVLKCMQTNLHAGAVVMCLKLWRQAELVWGELPEFSSNSVFFVRALARNMC